MSNKRYTTASDKEEKQQRARERRALARPQKEATRMGRRLHLTKQFALNTEMAYKRNDGHATIGGAQVDDWNASSFGFLFGAKLFF